MSEKRVLFLSRDRGSVQAIAPVAARLGRSVGIEPLVLSFRRADATYERLGIKPIVVDEGVFLSNRKQFTMDLLNSYRPDAIVMGSSNPTADPPETPEQYLTLIAKGRQTPTISILDTWGYYRERFGLLNGGNRQHGLLPDLVCVLDKICFRDFLDLGVPAERLRITHNPWMDENVRASQTPPTPAECVHSDAFNILFVSQPLSEIGRGQRWPYTQHDLFRILCAAACRLVDHRRVRIIVWVHPAEDRTTWAAEVKAERPYSIVLADERGAEVLAHVDALVTSHSTATYDALYFGTPCIMLRPGNPPPVPHLPDRLGLTSIVSREDDLFAELSSIGPSTRAALKAKKASLQMEGLLFSDGHATEKVTSLVRTTVGA